MSKRQKFTPEFRAEAVELALTPGRSLVEVAASLGTNEGTLGNWVRKYRQEHPDDSSKARGRVEWAAYEKLQREMSEVNRGNEFLETVNAFAIQCHGRLPL